MSPIQQMLLGVPSGGDVSYACEFNGTNQSLEVAVSNGNFNFNSNGDVTVEFFVKLDTLTNGSKPYQTFVGRWESGGDEWLLDTDAGKGNVNLYRPGGSGRFNTSDNVISANQWHHIAAVKNGTTGTIFVDGVSKVTNGSGWPSGSSNNSTPIDIGNNCSNFGCALDGKISNFRFTHGALYTSNFTPPSSPLENDAGGGTMLLMCQDTSPTVALTNQGGTITNNGSVTTTNSDTPFS